MNTPQCKLNGRLSPFHDSSFPLLTSSAADANTTSVANNFNYAEGSYVHSNRYMEVLLSDNTSNRNLTDYNPYSINDNGARSPTNSEISSIIDVDDTLKTNSNHTHNENQTIDSYNSNSNCRNTDIRQLLSEMKSNNDEERENNRTTTSTPDSIPYIEVLECNNDNINSNSDNNNINNINNGLSSILAPRIKSACSEEITQAFRGQFLETLKTKNDGNAKRPMNAYMLFCKVNRSSVKEKYPGYSNREISQILGKMWHELDKEEWQKYTTMAFELRKAHYVAYPDFKWSRKQKRPASYPIKRVGIDGVEMVSTRPKSSIVYPYIDKLDNNNHFFKPLPYESKLDYSKYTSIRERPNSSQSQASSPFSIENLLRKTPDSPSTPTYDASSQDTCPTKRLKLSPLTISQSSTNGSVVNRRPLLLTNPVGNYLPVFSPIIATTAPLITSYQQLTLNKSAQDFNNSTLQLMFPIPPPKSFIPTNTYPNYAIIAPNTLHTNENNSNS